MVRRRQSATETTGPAGRHDDQCRQGRRAQARGRHRRAFARVFDDLSAVLSHLDDLGVRTRILFLDASDEVLIKRYESVRRPHPLQRGNRLIDGILEERSLLANLKERADMVIDTSSLSIHQLSTKLYEAMLGSGPSTVAVNIFSFGFKYGLPMDADFVADVRFLPNPFWVPTLRELNGQDKPVSDYVLSSPGAG